MNRFLSALITTIIQLPIILWLFIEISLNKTGYIAFTTIGNFIMLACMVYFAFFIATSVRRVNSYRIYSYFLAPISIVTMEVFGSWGFQLLLYFSYLGFTGYYFRKERYIVYIKNIELNLLKKLAKFDTKKEAKFFIKNLIDQDLKKLIQKIHSPSKLKETYLSQRKTVYRVNKQEFKENKYLSKVIPKLIKKHQLDMIDGGFEMVENNLLEEISECEVIEVYQLKENIEIEYIKYGIKKHLSIKEIHYINPKDGITNGFLLEDKALDNGYSTKEYNKQTQEFVEKEYLKESHPLMSDIFFIVKIFYFQKKETDLEDTKLIIIYKTIDGITSSYQLYFNEEKLQIQKYENIFRFATRLLDDTHKTQLEFSYDDNYFSPKRSYDIFNHESNTVVRKTLGNNPHNFPCTTFGEKIEFKFDKKLGISTYNLAIVSKEYQVVNETQYNLLTLKEKEKLHHFLFLAQLYINNLFVNREFDNTFILSTKEHIEHHKVIDNLQEALDHSVYLKQEYYAVKEKNTHVSKLVYIYQSKKDKYKRFLMFQEIGYANKRYTIKFNNNVKEELKTITEIFSISNLYINNKL